MSLYKKCNENEMKIFILHVTLLLIIASCSVKRHNSSTLPNDDNSGNKTEKELFPAQMDIAPGHCRILATVLEIDSTSISQDPEDLCSKVPCRAVVRVDTILGYGSSFSGDVSKGKEMPVRFVFSTKNTRSLGMKMEHHLPGLKSRDRFRADIKEQPVFGGGLAFVVHLYEKIKD
jgi:hypothetical protein